MTTVRSAVALLLLSTLSVATDDDVVPPTFKIQPENFFSKGLQYYRTLRIDKETSSLYVGTMNHLYRLWAYNINDTNNKAFYAENELLPADTAFAKCKSRSHNQGYYCQNHIRVILKNKPNSLLICGTNAKEPAVFQVDSKTLAVTEASVTGLAVCPVDPDDNGTAVWVEGGNPGGVPVFYTGTVVDFTQTNRVIYRPPLFDKDTKIQNFMRTDHRDSKILNAPNFVASYDIGDFVYFFFRESAVEYTNCGKAVYSRVARICKNDVGGEHMLQQNWATFLKARLNCSIPGEFPFYFNEIQAVEKVDASGEVHFYAVFTTSLNGFYGSAICAYRLSDINHIFDTGKFKEQTTSTNLWLPVRESDVPIPRPGQCTPDTKQLPSATLSFIKTHPLMDEAVPMLGSNVDQLTRPIYFKRDVVMTTIAVDTVTVGGNSYWMVMAGTADGEIVRVLQWFSPSGAPESFVLSIDQLPRPQPIRALQLLTNEYLYASQDEVISQVSMKRCGQYQLCRGCTSDPFCAWSTVRATCHSHEDVKNFNAGWIQISASSPKGGGLCPTSTRRVSRALYQGDAAHLDCQHPKGTDVYWLHNNRSIEQTAAKVLRTVDGGLVLVNASKGDVGVFDCVSQRQVLISYEVYIDDVNCQRPHNAQSYQAVYREWCKEFQDYKHMMVKYKQQLEENTQCLNGRNFNRLPLENLKLADSSGPNGIRRDSTNSS